jgi:hypothetical protein
MQSLSAPRCVPPAAARPVALRQRAPAARILQRARAAGDAALAASPELSVLSSLRVVSVSSGEAVPASSLVSSTSITLLPFLTNCADFDSFELASQLVDYLPALDAAGVRLSCVCIGSCEAALAFSRFTNFPAERLWADERALCYDALGFAPGAGRPGGEAPFLANASGLTKLMAMCAGLGSPGTLPEVFRGYLGDKSAAPVFREGSNIDVPWREAFNLVGTDCQRPFELATLRGKNMVTILQNWSTLAPRDEDLLVQRGGTLIFGDGRVTWRHDDKGILGFAPAKVAVAAAGVTDC